MHGGTFSGWVNAASPVGRTTCQVEGAGDVNNNGHADVIELDISGLAVGRLLYVAETASGFTNGSQRHAVMTDPNWHVV